METIFNIIHPFFDKTQTQTQTQTRWQCQKKENTLLYKCIHKCDEFIITVLPKTAEIEITVPLHQVQYKNKFTNVESAIDYVKMHLNYYDEMYEN
jgi:hypothetical protein